MADPGVTPNGTLPRYLVLKVWGHDPAVDRVAEALDAAGIQATVSCARRMEPRHQPHGMPFEPRRTVNFAEPPDPTVTIEIPLKVAQTWAKAGVVDYAGQEAVEEACRSALRETHTEAPVLRVGAKVRRYARYAVKHMGRYGIGTVLEVRKGGAMVKGPDGQVAYWDESCFGVVE